MNAARLKLARLCIDQALAEWRPAQDQPPMREDAFWVAARPDGRHEVKTVAGEVLAVCATNAEAWGWMTGGATKGEGIRSALPDPKLGAVLVMGSLRDGFAVAAISCSTAFLGCGVSWWAHQKINRKSMEYQIHRHEIGGRGVRPPLFQQCPKASV